MSQLKTIVRTIDCTKGTQKTGSANFHRTFASIMFTDIEDWTGLAAELGLEGSSQYLVEHVAMAKKVVRHRGGDLRGFTGDGILAIWSNEGEARETIARHAIEAAADFARKHAWHNGRRQESHRPFRRVRIGLHCGEVMLGAMANGRHACAIGATNHARRVEQAGKSAPKTDDDAVIMASVALLRLAGYAVDRVGSKEIVQLVPVEPVRPRPHPSVLECLQGRNAPAYAV